MGEKLNQLNQDLAPMKTENESIPPLVRWTCEENTLTDDRTGEEYLEFVPVLLSPLCSPVRFAVWHADKWDETDQERAKTAAMQSAREAAALLFSSLPE